VDPLTAAKIVIFDQYLDLASMAACWTVECHQHFEGAVIYSTERQSLFMAGDG